MGQETPIKYPGIVGEVGCEDIGKENFLDASRKCNYGPAELWGVEIGLNLAGMGYCRKVIPEMDYTVVKLVIIQEHMKGATLFDHKFKNLKFLC